MPPIRREPPVLLVFIKGRWQNVPPGCGFAVSRRGKLEELRTGAVRNALRRLQMCLPSKARLGPRLSFKKIPPDGEKSDHNVNLIERKENIAQNRDMRPCKRRRDTTSSEAPIRSVTTVATIHPAKLPKTSKNHQLHMTRRLSSESQSSEAPRTDSKNQKSKEIMESPKKSSISSRILLDSPKRGLILRSKPNDQTNWSKHKSPILKSKDLTEKQISRYLQPRSEKLNRSPKKIDTIFLESDIEMDPKIFKTKQNHSPKKTVSNSENNTIIEKFTSNNRNFFYKIGSKRQKLDQNTTDSESPTAENIFQRPRETYQTNSKVGTCKELEIGEQDIELLRIFLQNHYSDSVLLKFDADDEYKRMIFFRINPLVDIEWCPVIDRMLRRSQDSQLTLTDFASNLGLKSVTEAASVKTQRYKIRNRTAKSYVDSGSDSSSEDKENNVKIPRRIEKTKILKEREHNIRESKTRESKAKESMNKVSNKRVSTRKIEDSDPELSITKDNKKARRATERTTRNDRTVENESEDSNAKEKIKRAGRAKNITYTNSAESDSENSNKVEKVKVTKPINRNTAESESEESNTNETHKKAGITKKLTRANHNTVETESETSDTNKNNFKANITTKQTKAVSNKVDDTRDSNAKKEKRNSDDNDLRGSNAKRVDRNQRDVDDTVELSSGSETAVKAVKKTVKAKPVISSKRRRAKLEYSSLEDQAIVAWVSTGSRASRVNGNLLWRQLQDQYTQITGCRRTWHSLRNRYLRYILPKLGDLALPLSQQTRLRAAAATGEIKAQKASRRNSIFKLPPRGAASKRIAQTNYDTETEEKELPSKRSPRYSSLIRQFARRNNMARPSSELSDSSQRSNKLEVAGRGEKSEEKSPKKPKPSKAMNSPHKQTNSRAVTNEHSDSDGRNESPRRDKGSSDSSESEDESSTINESRRTRRSVNESNKRMSTRDTRQTSEAKHKFNRQLNMPDEPDESKGRKSRNVADKLKFAREKTNESSREKSPKKTNKAINSPHKQTNSRAVTNEHSDSDGRSESPRRDKDSSDSSSESEDESNTMNESRRTRRSVNESNKRMSTRDTRQTSEVKQKLNRQSKGRKSRDVADKLKSARENTNESARGILNRHKPPSEQSSRESPENNRRRSRRHTKNINDSDGETNESKSRRSQQEVNRSPTRKSNRNKSPMGSNTSVSRVRRESKSPIKRKSTRHDSSSEESDSSSGSVSQPQRKTNRLNLTTDRSNRRKSNRLTPNESSNKRRHSSESKRKSKLAKRNSLDEVVVSDSSESFETKRITRDSIKKINPPNKRVDKHKMRKLFNPKAIL